MDSQVLDLLTRARANRSASAVLDLSPALIQALISHAGWKVVPNRADGQPVDTLRPTAASAARPHSLSASTGAGEQPLHTDGAHLVEPPDLILLIGQRTSTVPTSLWTPQPSGSPSGLDADLRHGLFVVSPGGPPFLAHALSRGRLRFDPGCMSPADERAERVASYFADQRPHGIDHHWDRENLVLAIDNRRVLHARGNATNEPDRSLARIAVRVPEETP